MCLLRVPLYSFRTRRPPKTKKTHTQKKAVNQTFNNTRYFIDSNERINYTSCSTPAGGQPIK